MTTPLQCCSTKYWQKVSAVKCGPYLAKRHSDELASMVANKGKSATAGTSSSNTRPKRNRQQPKPYAPASEATKPQHSFKCEKCSKEFKSKRSLSGHARIHSETTPKGRNRRSKASRKSTSAKVAKKPERGIKAKTLAAKDEETQKAQVQAKKTHPETQAVYLQTVALQALAQAQASQAQSLAQSQASQAQALAQAKASQAQAAHLEALAVQVAQAQANRGKEKEKKERERERERDDARLASSVHLALQMQQPLMALLNAKIPGASTAPHSALSPPVCPVKSGSNEQAEYEAIINGYSTSHDLFGLPWTDFIEQTQEELAEVIDAASGFKDRRALGRLYRSAHDRLESPKKKKKKKKKKRARPAS